AADAVEGEIARLHDLSVADLRERWLALYGTPAPKYFRTTLLVRTLAHQIQVQAFGGLSDATKRRLRHIYHAGRDDRRDGVLESLVPRLKPGTRLLRSWQGKTHCVNVLAKGFEWQGQHYQSLSAVAKAISGTNWNGHAFFGTRKKVSKQLAGECSPQAR